MTIVALVGNPNTGKSTLFNALSGLRQQVGNYPGVTVETKKGHFSYRGRTIDLIDLPGTYSLAPRSPDEMVAVDVLLGRQRGEPRPDVVISILDASNLDRNLYLTSQVLELGVPVVVAVNMIDLAEQQQIRLDLETIETRLGCPVVPIQANCGKGLDRLREVVFTAATTLKAEPAEFAVNRSARFPDAFEREVKALAKSLAAPCPEVLLRRALLDVGGYTEQRLAGDHAGLSTALAAARERLTAAGCGVPAVEARTRYAWIRTLTAGAVRRPDTRVVTWTDRLDRVLTHKLWGSLVFLVMMLLLFLSIFWVAQWFMAPINTAKDFLSEWLITSLPPGPFTSLLAEGVVKGVGAVVVFLPQIMILFGFIAVLEDCGYMARAAYLMDRLMSRCGLSGKSFIPMLSSVACAVPGIMAARVIEHRRDRFATILVAPLMSCSARLPVYVLMIGTFLTTGYSWWVPGLVLFGLYSLGLVIAPLVALVLKRTLLRGDTPMFVMEMPLYKRPSARTVIRRVADAGSAFLYRAGTFILMSMVVIWFLLYVPSTDAEGRSYPLRLADLTRQIKELEEHNDEATKPRVEDLKGAANRLSGEWKGQSLLGRAGHLIEPVVRPLGWDWRIGMAALASFPAREVVVGTLGIIYNVGKVESDEIQTAERVDETDLGRELKNARWDDDPSRPVFTVPVAMSLMVFFALCCQCASTLAVIRRETGSWWWAAFTFVYMTALAYVAAFVVYQIGSRLG